VCHTIVVHPPGGIAGGDALTVAIRANEGAHALLTTPGAAKWYRSAGPWAESRIDIDAGPHSIVEWLPQESIVFDGALARWRWTARLAPGARVFAWDIVCLGRTGSGERFTRGAVGLDVRIVRDARSLWVERGLIEPGSRAVESPAGLSGHAVFGTLVLAGAGIDDGALAECRALSPAQGEGAVTRMPDLFVARYRGDSSEAARRFFTGLWTILRPRSLGRAAVAPRIWRT